MTVLELRMDGQQMNENLDPDRVLGIVIRAMPGEGYGFLCSPDHVGSHRGDIFMHVSDCAHPGILRVGNLVACSTVKTEKGLQARDVLEIEENDPRLVIRLEKIYRERNGAHVNIGSYRLDGYTMDEAKKHLKKSRSPEKQAQYYACMSYHGLRGFSCSAETGRIERIADILVHYGLFDSVTVVADKPVTPNGD